MCGSVGGRLVYLAFSATIDARGINDIVCGLFR